MLIFSSCYTTVPTTYRPAPVTTKYYFNVEPVIPYTTPYYYNPYYVSPYYYRPHYYTPKPKPYYPHNNNYHYGPRRGR